MESVIDIKDWLLTKCKANSTTSNKNSRDCSSNIGGAITPETIPEFVIPKANGGSRRGSYDIDNLDSEHLFSVSRRSSICSNKTSPGISPSASAVVLETRYASSAPGSPRHEIKDMVARHKTSKSMNCIGDTNSDPLSVAAMSLHHFRSKTTFGFSTLSQTPHTRRKESLFHIQGNGLSSQDSQRLRSLEALSIRGRPDMMDDVIRFSDPDISTRKHTPSVIVTPSASQMGSSEMLSPERQPNHLLAASRLFIKNGNVANRNLKKGNVYYRRRSSLLGLDTDESNTSSQDSLVEDSQPKKSSKRNEKDVIALKRHSSPQLRESGLIEACEPHRSKSCAVINSSPSKHATKHGELKFAFQYLATTKQLKLTLIKAECLGGSDKTDSNLNPYAKVYLMPGKLQKQVSELFKHTRKPIFDRSFFFQGLSLKQLHAMTLRIKIFHKSHNLRPPELVGRTDLELENYDLITENRMWKDLDTVCESEDLGALEVSMRFEPRDGCLVIGVRRGIGLPEHQIKGPPDPYVKVEVIQPGKSALKRVTKTKKSTTDPVFNESYNFPVSFKMDDISYTYVTLTVYSHERIKSDEIIGQVGLGFVATQDSEIKHWREMMQNPGKEISEIHSLLDLDDDQKLKL
ncbi:synaptotagmin-1-like [Saccostrea echinata]|uniref:synaptotagmin-1-like n=1 Tax=Saccostrea echinata TaxID=191078 RepID=UPI002A836547|nr:synaptotagmin-1-like [Saccostrea echinata]